MSKILLINANRFKQPWPVIPFGLLCVARSNAWSETAAAFWFKEAGLETMDFIAQVGDFGEHKEV